MIGFFLVRSTFVTSRFTISGVRRYIMMRVVKCKTLFSSDSAIRFRFFFLNIVSKSGFNCASGEENIHSAEFPLESSESAARILPGEAKCSSLR